MRGTLFTRERALNQNFDSVALWERIGRDPELLGELIAVFEAESPAMLDQMDRALKEGRPESLQKVSHKFKGSLLQFSAARAAAIAQELEQMARSGVVHDGTGVITELKAEIAEVMAALRRMQSQGGPL